MATHFSILSWRIPWTEESNGYSAWSHRESNTAEQLTPSHFHFSPFFTQEDHLNVSLSSLLLYILNIPITPSFHLDRYISHLALHLQTQCPASFPLFQPNFMPSCLLTKLLSCPWLFFLHIIFHIPKKYFPKA